jgi:hypothetical protein
MAVTIEMQNTGDPRARREILAGVEHVLSDVAGEWRVSIVGSRANDNWEMKVQGPRGFERSYPLVGEAEHRPEAIRNVLTKLLAPGCAMIYHAGSRCPAAEADIAGLAGSVPRDGGTSDEEDSQFESSPQRPYFASVEQN